VAAKASAAEAGAEPEPVSLKRRPGDVAGRLTELALGYQRVLAANPHEPHALLGMSVVAQASGQHHAAIQMAQAAVAAAPGSCVAWVALAQAQKAAGQAGASERSYLQAIRLDGMQALARAGLGELRLAAGRPEDAAAEFDLALRSDPRLIAAHMGQGHALACMGRNEGALACYEQVLMLRPRLPEAEFAAGFVLARLGRLRETELRYRRALSVRPDFAAAWLNLGNLLREHGRELHAESALQRAVELRPDLIPGWINLALLERERRNIGKAESHLQRALDLDPHRVETLVAWCQFRVAEKDRHGAWHWLARVFAADPRHGEAVNMLGILLHNEARYDEAVSAFARAESLGSMAATSNRGNALLELGRDVEALRAHESAVERDPHAPGALYNLALTRLRFGDWRQGWRDYEARWRFRDVHRNPRVFPQPRWQGELLKGRRILLHAEQGLGDTIQFSRYLSMVAARGGRVLLQVQEPLARLMQSLYAVRSGDAEVALLGEKPPAFDLECPLMSLPAVFGTTVDTVPWRGPYLAAARDAVRLTRARLPSARSGLRIGIAWAGNPRYRADAQRSTALETFLPLIAAHSANWFSLQKGEAAAQLGGLSTKLPIHDACSQDRDLADTAAVIATLDLVITTDTAIAHLAGAMGRPVWILLPQVADWRWMQHIETSPWYPAARLFRQRFDGGWAEVIERVSLELALFRQPWLRWLPHPLRRASRVRPARAA